MKKVGGSMFFKSLLRYKWYALSSFLMTSLMIASSLLLPWFLKHILDALQEQNSQTIYSMGGWLIGIGFVGLAAGGINVTLLRLSLQISVKRLFARFRPFLMPISRNSTLEI